MNRIYVILSIIALSLGSGLLFISSKKNTKELSPELLLEELMDKSRFVSSDNLARMIINQDPSFQLIDLRESTEYEKYHLPGAINIPLGKILEEGNQAYFDQDIRKSILYSNGTIYANQAWVLLKRNSYKGLLVLRGGLNDWARTILSPSYPAETAPKEDWETYEFRLGASRFFTGASISTTQPKQIQVPIKRRKKKSIDGGC